MNLAFEGMFARGMPSTLLLYQIPQLEPKFYPPLKKPPKQIRMNPKPFPTEHTTINQGCEFH